MTHTLQKFALACLAAAPLLVFAADEAPSVPEALPPSAQEADTASQAMEGKRCKDGHRCADMAGKRCEMDKMGHRMMRHGPPMAHAGMLMVPRLPPGNEKAQLQMEAEIHQRMGEILSKYAAQLK